MEYLVLIAVHAVFSRAVKSLPSSPLEQTSLVHGNRLCWNRMVPGLAVVLDHDPGLDHRGAEQHRLHVDLVGATDLDGLLECRGPLVCLPSVHDLLVAVDP